MADPMVVVSREGAVVTLRLDRPKVNALSIALTGELEQALVALHADPPGALVVTGGPRIFAAGAEIAELAEPARGAELVALLGTALDLLASLPCATIAAVNGVAYGGGLELALACDLRVIADDARLGLPEILLGLFPGGGGTQRLPRLVGPAVAKSMILSGREVRAEEALAVGLAEAAHPADEVLGRALELAGRFASGPRGALAVVKALIDGGLEGPLADGLAAERARFVETLSTEDARIGMASFFASGPGHAEFTGR
ncbi:MAG TPA: enoyl-CoA hydratase-related protein [Acidimicrobiales bacterium]|nr:enoyl-CoA hydratase-related protein [Acidimicrobiales bacterium]